MYLTLDNISKNFGNNRVLSAVSFGLRSGETLGIIGPNGAGKTTLLNVISGFVKPDSGQIIIGDTLANKLKPYQISRLGVSRTFQIPKYAKDLTILENVISSALFSGNSTSLEDARRKAEIALCRLRLTEKAEQYPLSLSTSELKKTELARVLVSNAKIALLDEVTAGQSEGERSTIIKAIKDYQDETHASLIIVDHVLQTIVDICPRVIVLDKGVKIAEGAPEEIFNNEAVIQAYVGERRIVRVK